jgi:C1A family cysteine protease
MPDDEPTLGELKAKLEEQHARWKAAETPFATLSLEEKRRRLGYEPGPDDLSLEDRERAARAVANAAEARAGVVGAPVAFDWRNVGGSNYITPIEDQGGCGSCVAFGAVAAVEGLVRTTRGDPNYAIDLSEAHLFFCYGPSSGAGKCPGGGWWPDAAFDAFKQGVVDSACFPYTAVDQSCNLCADWQNRLTKITGWHKVTTPADMKSFISSVGPVSTCFTVYNDFFSYAGGIYHHITGGVAGGHCVAVVGYDDNLGCWICKNSWGSGFGESGFFRIAYGECGIDAGMWAAEGIVATGWERNKQIIGLWANDSDRNAWAYVNAVGWRKIAPDSDNIFFDLMNQLVAAKAAARPVDFYETNGVIQQLYVY